MTKCAICGRDELLPFVCRYCGQSFCSEHRLPESHNCIMVGARVVPMQRVDDRRGSSAYARSTPFKTSRTEIIHLTAAILVFFAVEAPRYLQFGTFILASIGSMIALSFILHELAHKFVAQYYGMWSEFRLDPLGTMLSLFTALSPIKLIAPGAVVIFGFATTRDKVGKISMAGPLANIVQILLFTFLSQFHWIFGFAVLINADIAFFNLLPISILDGRKIFGWSKKAWAALFLPVLVLWILFSF